jgi:hypothetical protein
LENTENEELKLKTQEEEIENNTTKTDEVCEESIDFDNLDNQLSRYE